jgi:cytochrome c oxidase subunit IV
MNSTVGLYVKVYLALLVLLGITVAISFVHLGALNTPLALTIAMGKAALVVFFFMHLRETPPQTRLMALTGLIWLSILLMLPFADYLTRDWLPRILD